MDWSTVVLAKHIGQHLTSDVMTGIAKAIADGPCTPIDLSQFEPQAYKGYTIQAERMANILPELHALHEAHYLETEIHRAGIPMNPDYRSVLRLERGGRLLQVTARHNGELVGNMRVYISESLHTQTLVCTEDTFFMRPEHRGGFLAVRMWQFTERAVIALGVREIYFDSKIVNRADSMARYLKYQAVGIKFAKVISVKD